MYPYEKSLETYLMILCKETECCFEQIFEAAFSKTAIVRPLTSNLTNHTSKTNKTYPGGEPENELVSDIFLWSLTYGLSSVGWPAKTYMT